MASHNVLITSASGNIGKLLIPLLANSAQASSYTLVLPTRDASRINIPAGTNAQIHVVEGDVHDALWLESLMTKHSITTVVSNFTYVEELMLTLNLWSAAEACGVKHMIYISAAFDSTPQAISNGALTNVGAAHCAYKFIGEGKLMHGNPKFSWTILGPSLFFSNDVRAKSELMKPGDGFLYEPLGATGCSRVDPQDIALGIKIAIDDAGAKWNGRKICIGTKQKYTGAQTAQIWSKALGKRVESAQTDVESLVSLEKTISKYRSKLLARDLRLMCVQFNADGFGMTDEQYRDQVEFLGKEASSYEEFVKNTADAWKTEATKV